MDIEGYARRLQEAGVEFILNIPDRGGVTMVSCEPDELNELLEDPVAVYARHHGVTPEQYRAWMDAGFMVTCSATTTKGRPCRNSVPGATILSAREWADHPGGYCDIHENGSNCQR